MNQSPSFFVKKKQHYTTCCHPHSKTIITIANILMIMMTFLLSFNQCFISSFAPSLMRRTSSTHILHHNFIARFSSSLSLLPSSTTQGGLSNRHFFIRFFSTIQNDKINKNRYHPTTALFMETDDDDVVDDDSNDNNDNYRTATKEKTTWNIPGLKKEISRLTLRCHKKIGKASIRLNQAMEQVEELRTNPDATVEELESCPNVILFETELRDLQERLRQLTLLQEKLHGIKKTGVVLPDNILSLVIELDVNDEPPKREERPQKKKKKGPKVVAPRLPYFRYYTENQTEIRVGRRSQDNDELSCNPKHRDSMDWWMHASGCPGSHVVIRCHDSNLDKDVIMDAAALAARQSKCSGNIINVNLTRCRDVKKPPGAKFGLVQLVGKVETISVNMKLAEKRLERLDSTMLMNEDD